MGSATNLTVVGMLSLGITLTAQKPLEFEVSSVKRNLGDTLSGDTRRLPNGTVIVTNVSLRNLLPSAWPGEDFEIRNLPDWANRDRYDVTVKPFAGASPAQIQDMWRTLFKDRFKLEARYEARETPIYALVVARADGRLGPQIKPSPHDCAALAAASANQPPPPSRTSPLSEEEAIATCGSRFVQGRAVVGGTLLSTFARGLSSSVGRIVEDRTGLPGYYAFTLTVSAPTPPGAEAPDPNSAPSIFTALQEQLGLKLEPARKLMQTVVIVHVEQPTEN